jgi:hypothetical protein
VVLGEIVYSPSKAANGAFPGEAVEHDVYGLAAPDIQEVRRNEYGTAPTMLNFRKDNGINALRVLFGNHDERNITLFSLHHQGLFCMISGCLRLFSPKFFPNFSPKFFNRSIDSTIMPYFIALLSRQFP